MFDLQTFPNPDLVTREDNKSRWNLPDTRRHGFQNLHRLARYGLNFRSDHVLALTRDLDPKIGEDSDVQALTSTEHFCAMAVIKDQTLLYEKYAPDFSADHPHTIMSISKMTLNLIMGELVAAGKVHMDAKISEYLPGIGSGYAKATVQQVANMDIENSYQEDYSDPYTGSFAQEFTIGWRLPEEGQHEPTMQEFLATITAPRDGSLDNTTSHALYKSANTDVLAWLCEEVSGKPLRQWILEIVEATGIEGNWYMHTDRQGFPVVDGGVCLNARDLARFGQLFARRGAGVKGRKVGDANFIERSRNHPGPPIPSPKDFYSYSNQTMTNGVWLGHGGYGGQFMLANLDTGVSVSFFSVLENKDAIDPLYSVKQVRMMENVAAEFG
jgi:CubicO group peptidase (beta-lactamase class C family)